MAHKIYTNIQKGVKDASLPLLMKASNIFGRGFGERKITPMLEEFPNILVSKDSDATKIAKITGVSGWSTKTATEFVKHIGAFVAFLKECGLEDRASGKSVKKATKSVDESHPLFGKRIVITGFRPKELMTQIESMGGVLGSSVSKKTFTVIVKDLDEDTGKAGQARELGIPIMTPDSFKQKYALQ